MSASVKSSSLLRKRRPAKISAVFLKAQEMIKSTLSVAHAVESKLKDLESRFESIDAVQRTLAASLRPGLPVELPVWLGTSQIAALRELRPPPPGVLVESADMRVKCTAIIRIVKNAAGRLHAVERRAQELFIQYLGLATAQQGL